jgi:hypothetical protein
VKRFVVPILLVALCACNASSDASSNDSGPLQPDTTPEATVSSESTSAEAGNNAPTLEDASVADADGALAEDAPGEEDPGDASLDSSSEASAPSDAAANASDAIADTLDATADALDASLASDGSDAPVVADAPIHDAAACPPEPPSDGAACPSAESGLSCPYPTVSVNCTMMAVCDGFAWTVTLEEDGPCGILWDTWRPD